jgi:hypothetical protein
MGRNADSARVSKAGEVGGRGVHLEKKRRAGSCFQGWLKNSQDRAYNGRASMGDCSVAKMGGPMGTECSGQVKEQASKESVSK